MGLDNIIFLLFIKGKRQFASLISLNVALFFFFLSKDRYHFEINI